jgi:hypothetical protein
VTPSLSPGGTRRPYPATRRAAPRLTSGENE